MLTTAYSVVGVRKIVPSKQSASDSNPALDARKEPSNVKTSSPKPFSDEINNSLRLITAASAVSAVISQRFDSGLSTPLTSLFMLGTTLSTFVFGARLPKPFTKVVHPLVTCTVLTWTIFFGFARILGTTFQSILKGYRTNSLSPGLAGAGDVSLSFGCFFRVLAQLNFLTLQNSLSK